MKRLVIFVVLLHATASAAHAADAFVYQFAADGRTIGCNRAQWGSDLLVHNATDAAAEIRLLGLSNGDLLDGVPRSWTIPPHESRSLRRLGPAWVPTNGAAGPGWILHLDVPAGVTMESRDEVADVNRCDDKAPFMLTKTSQPIVRDLTPANNLQVKMGTDLGTTAGRINVAIYNAGTSAAVATIEVRRTCDDAVVTSTIVQVPAHAITQYGPFPTGGDDCADARTSTYSRYTTITVDQPSATFVSTLTEGQQQSPGDVLPLIELGVNLSTTF